MPIRVNAKGNRRIQEPRSFEHLNRPGISSRPLLDLAARLACTDAFRLPRQVDASNDSEMAHTVTPNREGPG